MHDGVGAKSADLSHHSLSVRDIQRQIGHGSDRSSILQAGICRCQVAPDSLIPSAAQLIHDIVPKLTADACYQYFHIDNSFCR